MARKHVRTHSPRTPKRNVSDVNIEFFFSSYNVFHKDLELFHQIQLVNYVSLSKVKITILNFPKYSGTFY